MTDRFGHIDNALVSSDVKATIDLVFQAIQDLGLMDDETAEGFQEELVARIWADWPMCEIGPDGPHHSPQTENYYSNDRNSVWTCADCRAHLVAYDVEAREEWTNH